MSGGSPDLVLGFDTSTAVTAAAVASADGSPVAESTQVHHPDERPAHASDLLLAIERCVEESGGWGGIERIAVGVGPGSFTGVRVSVATGRAIAQATGKRVVAIPSLSTLARGVAESSSTANRACLPVLDARRGEAFVALFDPAGSQISAPACVGPEEFSRIVRDLESPPLAVGDGALRFSSDLEEAGAEVAKEDSPAHSIAAANICRLALEAEPTTVETIEPIYLREPDARRWLDRDDQRSG